MSKIQFKIGIILLFALVAISIFSCNQEDEIALNEMLPKLSDYAIFKGKSSDLVPNDDYKFYELSSTLFTDYAEKQRLIKVPSGTSLKAINDGLVGFPEGTILVKTFYYLHDKREPSKGKNIIETRLLIKKNNAWKVGTFKWNNEQTDAFLLTSGDHQTVNWVGADGKANVISYRIPSNTDCKTCHRSTNDVIPIGPKVRNLNIDVMRNGSSLNQLTHLMNEGILNKVNPSQFSVLPNYHDTALSLEQRTRAYIEINCAHCHSDFGFARNQRPRFAYELGVAGILQQRGRIVQRLEAGEMPKLGTTVLDKESIELIKKYLNGL